MSKSDRTRQNVIEKAAVLLNTKGIAGTSINDIMKATGLAKGGIYGNFKTKELLTSAIVDYNLQRLVDQLTEAVGQAATYKDKLFAFLDFFAKPQQFPISGGCPILNFGTESDDTQPAVRGKVKVVIELAQSKISGIIRQGIIVGEFRPSFDARAFSILMFSAIEGGILIGRVLQTNTQMTHINKMLKQLIEAQMT